MHVSHFWFVGLFPTIQSNEILATMRFLQHFYFILVNFFYFEEKKIIKTWKGFDCKFMCFLKHNIFSTFAIFLKIENTGWEAFFHKKLSSQLMLLFFKNWIVVIQLNWIGLDFLFPFIWEVFVASFMILCLWFDSMSVVSYTILYKMS